MILLRHGQSEFNAHFTQFRVDPGIPDPRLTPTGLEQAVRAADALAAAGLRRIVVSPYTRALQTAAPLAARLGIPITVTCSVRERFGFACDIGTPRSALCEAWPEHDFSAIDEVWWPTEPEPEHAVSARADLFRAEQVARPDWPHTLVVTHWGFILALTGQSVPNGAWLRCPGPHAVR